MTVFDEKSNLRYFVNNLDFTKYSYANVTSTIERTMFCEMDPMSSFEAASSAYCSILSTKSLLPCTFFISLSCIAIEYLSFNWSFNLADLVVSIFFFVLRLCSISSHVYFLVLCIFPSFHCQPKYFLSCFYPYGN